MTFQVVALVLVFTMTPITGTDVRHQALVMPMTKYVKGVPIHNYQFALNVKDTAKEAQNCTTWLVQAHKQYIQAMRDVCAFTPLGKGHCKDHMPRSIPSFIFKGSEDKLIMLLESHHQMIEFVEPDFELWAIDDETPELPGVKQEDPYWGLDRIDERRGISGSYHPGVDGGYGKNAHVYVLDTGIMTTHEDFEGRAIPTLDCTIGSLVICDRHDASCAMDRQGHGTHCAGIIGGERYGVAKDVTMHAGKVLSDAGSGSFSWILMAFDWLVDHAISPAAVSMSLGGAGTSHSIKIGVDAVVNAGITVVIAAGNSNSDACNFQPAFVPSAITVGATATPFRDTSGDVIDPMSYYSNYGTCLDIWAPGSDITSCGISSNTASATMSGTSMACPAVAGAVALVMNGYPTATPSFVDKLLKNHSTKGTLGLQFGYPKPRSPEDLLYVGMDWFPRPKQSNADLEGLSHGPTLQCFLLVSIVVFAVIGVFAGLKWHKSAAGEAKMKPLLG